LSQGDSKGSAKGGESSSKRDVYPNPNVQVENVNTRTTTGCVAGNILCMHNDIGIWCWTVLFGIDSLLIKVLSHRVLTIRILRWLITLSNAMYPCFSWVWDFCLIWHEWIVSMRWWCFIHKKHYFYSLFLLKAVIWSSI